MRNISLFLALKYFRPRRNGFVSFHSGMAIFGITLGLTILILVTSVMNGFQKELKDRILETIPHASIIGDIKNEDFISIKDIWSPSCFTKAKPSEAVLLIFFEAFAIPFFRKNSIDFSISPLVSSRASLQSLNPTPVISLNFFILSNKSLFDM